MVLPALICLSIVSCQQGILNYAQIGQQGSNAGMDYNNDDVIDNGPVKGGSLSLFSTIPDTLNPLLTKNTYVNDFLGFIYEGLIRLDEKQKPLPVLSDSWYTSPDGLIWNFHIREGVHWSDGQVFSSEDVAFTVEWLLSAGNNSIFGKLLQNIATYAAVDSSNFKLILKKPNSFTAEMMTFPIIPKHFSKNADKIKDFKPVGTGPYSYDSTVKDKYILLKKNKDWWYPETRTDKSTELLFIDNIKIKLYNDPDDAINAFQTGDIDTLCVGIDDFNKYEGRTDLFLKKYVSRDFEFLTFNLYNPVLSDVSVRKAIAAAIDKEKILEEVLKGDAASSEMPLSHDSWIFEGKNGEASPRLNPREILLQGGWKEKNNTFRKSFNGVSKKLELELLVNDNNDRRLLIAEKICEQLRNAGIGASVKKLPWNDLFTQIDQAKFDMVYTGCRITQIPDISFLYSNAYLAPQIPIQENAGRNIAGYDSTIVNSYIDMLYRENDNEKRKVLYSNISAQLSNDLPYIGFYFLKSGVVYRKNIRGSLEPFTWNRYYDITGWYKSETQ